MRHAASLHLWGFVVGGGDVLENFAGGGGVRIEELNYLVIMQTIVLKRSYQPAEPTDGYRVFVDRLWPRGLTHEEFPYDLWAKDIAPSTELREWYHAAPARDRWDEFQVRYTKELLTNPAFDTFRREIATKPKVTLLFSSHDPEFSDAMVVRNVLLKCESAGEPV